MAWMMVLFGFQALFVFCMCYAIVSDFRQLLIPNWIIITLIAAFLPFALLYLEPVSVLWHLLVALVVLAFAIVFFSINWIGGGDVELLAGIALWAGPRDISLLLLLMSAGGALIAIVLMGLRMYGDLLEPSLPDSSFLKRLQVLAQEGQCPYGVAIGGAALALLHRIFME